MLSPESMAVLLACALAPVLVGVHMLLCRRRDGESVYADFVVSCVVYVVVLCVAAAAIWRSSLTLSQAIAGLSMAGFICLSYMQAFSQVSRGFSLRLMVDLHRCGRLDMPGLLREYCNGLGARWLLDKRFRGLEEAGLARREGGNLILTPWGAALGRAGIAFKRIVKPGQGG